MSIKINQEEQNLFNPYRNVSLIFKKKLQDQNNAYISFSSEISINEESFSEENFKQAIEVEISNMTNDPMGHRNSIHPVASRVMHECNLDLVLFSRELESSEKSPQSISFSKKESGYRASLFVKVKNPAHLNAILLGMNQSRELSIKLDLLCDDSTFSKLEEEKGAQVIVHGMSMSFNLPTMDAIIQSLK
jgi:hypothetical protein